MSTVDRHSGVAYAPFPLWPVLGVTVAVFALAHWDGAADLVRRWASEEEYSHGFFIPLVSMWFLWERRAAIAGSLGAGSWLGTAAVVASCLLLVLGALTDTFALSHASLLVTVFGLALALGGWSLLRVVFVPLAFLAFMVPLPYLISSKLTYGLQLVSSELGVGFIRLCNIPVYLEGNVIDLGGYQLGVVEACSGLRYLIPFLGLSFIAAYAFRGPLWQKAVVFLAAIPITIIMNGFRIGMIGVISQYAGISYAEGALHYFEGWVVFLGCLAILYAVMMAFAVVNGSRSPAMPMHFPDVEAATPSGRFSPLAAPFTVALTALALTGAWATSSASQALTIPDRQDLIGLPYENVAWKPRIRPLERDIEEVLGADDYVMADLFPGTAETVNLYVAQLDYQRDNRSWHSPQQCIPGGGWTIADLARHEAANVEGPPTVVNRVVITKGRATHLVYYWYRQRGREIADEWALKYYLMADALTKNRTDGAMVRLTTPVFPGEDLAAADARLTAILAEINPVLPKYVPD